MRGKNQIAIILCMTACALLLSAAPVFAQSSDIQGQQTGTQISSTLNGTSQPGSSIYRAGLLGLVNRVFGYFNQAPAAGTIASPVALTAAPKDKIKKSAPEITDASITVNEDEYPIAVENGKNGTISLADRNSEDLLTAGSINVNSDSTLKLTVTKNKFISYDLEISQELEAGWNTLDIIKYLGAGGLTLAKIKEVFNDSSVVTFKGTLTDSNAKTAAVSLEVILP